MWWRYLFNDAHGKTGDWKPCPDPGKLIEKKIIKLSGFSRQLITRKTNKSTTSPRRLSGWRGSR